MVHLPDRDSGPKFIKDFQIGPVAKGACGTLPGSGPRTEAFKRMGQENPCANQAHKSCNCLNHGYRPLSPAKTERLSRCTVKRIPWALQKSNPTDDLAQQ
jgi:hypothetical protein